MLEVKEKNGFVEIEVEPNLFEDDIVVYYGNADMTIEGKTKIGSFSNANIHFMKPKSRERIYYFLTDGKHFYMTSNRVIPLEGTFNTRDFGGYQEFGGKYVKWGLFYRSDALHKISEEDILVLKNVLR